MTKLQLFHVVQRKMHQARQTFERQTAICEFDENFATIILPKRLVLTYDLIAKVMHYQVLFQELKSNY